MSSPVSNTVDIAIAVAGDICLDVVGVPIPPPATDVHTADNWRQTGETRTYYLPGGAHLLEHFVWAASSTFGGHDAAVFGPRPRRPKSLANEFDGPIGELLSITDYRNIAERLTRDEIVHSLLEADYFLASPDEKKIQQLRILATHGFSGPKTDDPSLSIEPPHQPATVFVLDDTGNRFRHTPQQWQNAIRTPGADDSSARVIYKLHRPLPTPATAAENPLWCQIQKHFHEATIVIVSVDDLRDLDVVISRGLSWERTALDVVWNLLNTQAFQCLRDCPHLIVRFGLNGALYWHTASNEGQRSHRAWLFYDPTGIEGTGEQGRAGKMVGYGSAFTAAVAAAVACDSNGIHPIPDSHGHPFEPARCLCQGIQFGLIATRRLLEIGFGKRDQQDPFDYPGKELFANIKDCDQSFPCQPVPIIPGALVPDRGYWRLLESIFKGKKDLLEEGVKLVARGAKPATPAQKDAMKLLRSVPMAVFANALRTTDRREIENYRALYALMQAYIHLTKVQRPLSVAVFGPPGAGKSFGVKMVAEALGQVSCPRKLKSLTFNLSQYNHPDQLSEAFHEVRDIVLKGDIPLVFFDEFDAALAGEKLGWLKYFLAPMQDAEFLDNGVPHPIGQAIFVFAGGTSSTYADFARPFLASQDGLQKVADAKSERDFKDAKGPDFLSRLRGSLDIPGLDLGPPFDPYGPVEAFPCPAAILLRRAGILNFQIADKAPHLKDSAGACQITDNVLQALLYLPHFIHGNRSFEALLDMSSLPGAKGFSPSDLPSRSHTALHANSDQLHQLIGSGCTFPKAGRETIARAIHAEYLPPVGKRSLKKRSHREWIDLDDDLKESNREQADHIAVKLRMIELWFRKVDNPDLASTGVKWMQELHNLKTLAIAEHARWAAALRRDGWIAGRDNTDASRDDQRMVHNCLFPWDGLTPAQQQQDIDTVSKIPAFLAAAGYEIVKL